MCEIPATYYYYYCLHSGATDNVLLLSVSVLGCVLYFVSCRVLLQLYGRAGYLPTAISKELQYE